MHGAALGLIRRRWSTLCASHSASSAVVFDFAETTEDRQPRGSVRLGFPHCNVGAGLARALGQGCAKRAVSVKSDRLSITIE